MKKTVLGGLLILLLCTGATNTNRNPFEPIEPYPRPSWDDPSVLQYYAFQELSLQAIVWHTEKKLALFKIPQGKTILAKVGTPVGKKGGKITHIDDNMVVVKGSSGLHGGEFTFRIK